MTARKSSLAFWQRQAINFVKIGGIPKHVAFIMDGNRRFAREKGLGNVVEGHTLGFESLLNCLEWCLEAGVEVVTVYAFSQENFARPKSEVDSLMKLAQEKFGEFLSQEGLVMERQVRVRMWGRKELLPKDVQRAAALVVTKTSQNKGPRLNVCFSYSGMDELVIATQRLSNGLAKNIISKEDVNENLLMRLSYLNDDTPPNLVIRTSGETRLSDFLIMHLEHTSVAYMDELWPDISLWTILGVILNWQYHSYAGGSQGNGNSNLDQQQLLTLNSKRAEAYVKQCEEEDWLSWIELLSNQTNNM
jgi:ditrans,polycis-polyprenyl diphosphate synthase